MATPPRPTPEQLLERGYSIVDGFDGIHVVEWHQAAAAPLSSAALWWIAEREAEGLKRERASFLEAYRRKHVSFSDDEVLAVFDRNFAPQKLAQLRSDAEASWRRCLAENGRTPEEPPGTISVPPKGRRERMGELRRIPW